MPIKWFEEDYRLSIRVRQNVFEFSKEAYLKFGDNEVTVGIDKDERLIYIRACDKFGYKITANKAVNRICSVALSRWLVKCGIYYGKYAAWWDDKNKVLVAKY